MAITTQDGLIAARQAGQIIRMVRLASRASVAAQAFSVLDLVGEPGAGVLAGTNLTAGVVPTDATQGFPVVDAFVAAATGYIDRFECSNIVAGRADLYDLLWKAGAYGFAAAQTLTAQAAYNSRVLGGTNYYGLELWLECVTATTTAQTITVTYTNESGVAARSTGALVGFPTGSLVGRLLRLPLQAGDQGIQKIESVTSTGMTIGTFNVLVMRRLAGGRVRNVNEQDIQVGEVCGQAIVFADSALYVVSYADGTATQLPEVTVKIING